MWLVIAAVGIELVHSMFEYPLWNAHFLGVTALLTGIGARPDNGSAAASGASLRAAAAACAALALALALLLRDYMRLDETRITGTSVTLSSPADAARDAAQMRALARGLLAPTAEFWILRGTPLNRDELAFKLGMSERVTRHFPSAGVVVRRAALLALDGNTAQAHSLLEQALRSFPQRCRETKIILRHALAADRAAIDPLLAQTAAAKGCG